MGNPGNFKFDFKGFKKSLDYINLLLIFWMNYYNVLFFHNSLLFEFLLIFASLALFSPACNCLPVIA